MSLNYNGPCGFWTSKILNTILRTRAVYGTEAVQKNKSALEHLEELVKVDLQMEFQLSGKSSP